MSPWRRRLSPPSSTAARRASRSPQSISTDRRARRPTAGRSPAAASSLTLADGKKLTLPQTLSGSGIRYANEGETFVFWSKGDTAFVEEGASQTVTYKDCVGRKK